MIQFRRAACLALALAVSGCANNVYRVSNPSCEPPDSYPKYGRVGHQDTTYIVALMAGHSTRDAALLSFYNQAADDIWLRFSAPPVTFWGSATHWGYRHRIIAVLHSLHGGDVRAVADRQNRLSALIAAADRGHADYYWTSGFLLHALGDSFAHTRADGAAFGELYGHAFAGHTPDIIGERPDLYIRYVETMYAALETGDADPGALAEFIGHVRGLEGLDGSGYDAAIRDYRDRLASTPVLDCDVLAARLTLRDVDGYLRVVQQDLEDPGR